VESKKLRIAIFGRAEVGGRGALFGA